jgi:formate hydrogenlyase subunit 6/NADH:ubiquinone oxidoreductase subunit I
MSLLSKLKETVICLQAGRVTLPYPQEPAQPPAGFRGRPIFNIEKCIGCAGCANNCPAREILVHDICQVRIIGTSAAAAHAALRRRLSREGNHHEHRFRERHQRHR